MPFEKIMNATFALFSRVIPEKALACAFNIEYLQTGGYDVSGQSRPFFMYYDWLSGGWGGRNGRDGLGVTASPFGVGLMTQPVEGQDRLYPVRTESFEISTDSAGPGQWRGGVGLEKSGTIMEVEQCVLSYLCDRERAVVWGIEGGLPAKPHGLWLRRKGKKEEEFLGAAFSDVPVSKGERFRRGTSGGGGYGDPLKRDSLLVLEDVVDDYVSLERARKDYGVVLNVVDRDTATYTIDEAATKKERALISRNRKKWLAQKPKNIAKKYRDGELDMYDLIRRYGVICDWGTGELFEKTTVEFRKLLRDRAARFWD